MSKPVVHVPEGEHSEVGPSAADRWINCPGSVLASRGIKAPPSKYAMSGGAAHLVSEWVRRNGVPASTYEGYTLRYVYDGETFDFKCNKAMALSVQQFCDRVAKLPGYELIEARVAYEDVAPGGFGTLDSSKLNDLVCYTGDFKDGTGVKKYADMNEQLLLYSYGVWRGWKWVYQFDTFILDIYQPRLEHFDRAEITLDKLLQWVGDVVKPAATRALQPGAPFRAGSWCRFCKLRDSCGVRAEFEREKEAKARGNDFALIGL